MSTVQSSSQRPPIPGRSPSAPDRTVGSDAAKEFQQCLKKKRAQGKEPQVQPLAAKTTGEDPTLWSTDDPLRGQAHICTWKDQGAKGSSDDGAPGSESQGLDDVSSSSDRRRDSAWPAAAVTTACSTPRHDPVQDADRLEPMIWSQMNVGMGSQGQFELWLPSGQHIGVQYTVAPQSTLLLLEADSERLSRQLQACAQGIGQRMSQRSGRRVDVFAA
jgi:hypothetical protein